jgi:hypothetical protein
MAGAYRELESRRWVGRMQWGRRMNRRFRSALAFPLVVGLPAGCTSAETSGPPVEPMKILAVVAARV